MDIYKTLNFTKCFHKFYIIIIANYCFIVELLPLLPVLVAWIEFCY